MASFQKQLIGALAGGAMGLFLYGGYTTVKPVVTAWISIPHEGVTPHLPAEGYLADKDAEDERARRTVARTREIVETFGRIPYEEQPEAVPPAPAAIAPQEPQSPPPVVPPAQPAWEDVPSMPDSVEPAVGTAEAPALPDSGVGLGMGILGAMAGTGALRRKRIRALLAWRTPR